ncbi:MAG: inorganic phosphate transporter [Bradymonadaceae bacterium]
MDYVLYVALAFGFYMAWSIGSNDAANAMGTSVGSKAVTFKEAVIIAAIFEFGGAVVAGGDVTNTIRDGIMDPTLFQSAQLFPHGAGAELFAIGMMSALVAAAVWIHIAAFLGWPVSTTHSIVGAVTGFGVVSVGFANVNWWVIVKIVLSWGFSPVLGGLLAFFSFSAIRRLIFDADDPVEATKRYSPVLAFPVFLVLWLVTFFKGLSNVPLQEYGIGLVEMVGLSAVGATIASAIVWFILQNVDLSEGRAGRDTSIDDDGEAVEVREVERVFRYLQVITACFVAFAHGSNDVANSIGPLAAIVNLYDGTSWSGAQLGSQVPVPTWILVLGGLGIVIGLATYGYRVIETIGSKITDITPSRGFAAEFGAATTIMVGTKAGIPLSTTHTIVGAVIGVGFARGMNALNLELIWDIVKSWIYTIPFTAVLTILLYYLFSIPVV